MPLLSNMFKGNKKDWYMQGNKQNWKIPAETKNLPITKVRLYINQEKLP